MDEAQTQSRFLLDLYRGAGQQGAEHFQDWALERLSQDLHFDSALWASASATPHGPIGHIAHLFRQPMQMLVDYESIKHLDTLNEASLRAPGKSIAVVTRASLPQATHAYLDRYGLEQALTTLEFEPQIAAFAVISLYRKRHDQPFSDAEAHFKQGIFPHLVEANSRNKLIHLSNRAKVGVPTVWHSCAVDAQGLVRHAEAGFKDLAVREWPEWRGPYLPHPLRELIAVGANGGTMPLCCVARLSTFSDMTLVQLRERQPIDDLPERMRQVARLAAAGHSNKRIAQMLDISPNTVRNHLVEAYERLAVKNKAEMAGLVLRFEDDFTADSLG
jgi:DNA-binding CsgD family transcriptional regulator